MPWHKLIPTLVIIALGLACVNAAELQTQRASFEMSRYLTGLLLTVSVVACRTWYLLRNSIWLRAHPQHKPGSWLGRRAGTGDLAAALVFYLIVCG